MLFFRQNKKIRELYEIKNGFKKLSCPEITPLPDWMRRRISEDISTAFTWVENPDFLPDHILICQVKNGRIKFRYNSIKQLSHKRLHVVKEYFNFLSSNFTLPDLDFAVYYGDSLEKVPPSISLPTFTFAKKEKSKGPILIPDFEMLMGYDTFVQKLDDYIKNTPWRKKQNRSFWRGASTGGFLNRSNYLTIPRIKLATISLKYPELVNARISSVVQATEDVWNLLKTEGLLGSFSPVLEHFYYKYLLDVDGNSCTYSRLFWILYSNCVPVKQISPNIQWYYYGLEDMTNICFFNLTEDSLISKIQFLAQNDELAKEISENSSQFSKKYLNNKYTTSYILALLEALKQV
ncbi:MAG: hypothetical protein JJU12_04935 [Chlamydiales bacterium]|nr:hypothetical protein [Chlamydiales bacterium]